MLDGRDLPSVYTPVLTAPSTTVQTASQVAVLEVFAADGTSTDTYLLLQQSGGTVSAEFYDGDANVVYTGTDSAAAPAVLDGSADLDALFAATGSPGDFTSVQFQAADGTTVTAAAQPGVPGAFGVLTGPPAPPPTGGPFGDPIGPLAPPPPPVPTVPPYTPPPDPLTDPNPPSPYPDPLGGLAPPPSGNPFPDPLSPPPPIVPPFTPPPPYTPPSPGSPPQGDGTGPNNGPGGNPAPIPLHYFFFDDHWGVSGGSDHYKGGTLYYVGPALKFTF